MAHELTESQNTLLGVVAALIEGVILQPTLYWKNARAMNLPFSINPRIIYRGTAASIFNEMQLMGLQFGLTGFFQRWFEPSGDTKLTIGQTLMSATLGGAVAATTASPVELVMIQQQKHGGTFIGTPSRIIKEYGLGSKGLYRGLTPTIGRDSVYVIGMLGVIPLVQDYLIDNHNFGLATASFCASMFGGCLSAAISQPFDVIKTCMQGDVERATFGSLRATVKHLVAEGGYKRLWNGCMWRTVNIVGTVYIANECKNRLPPLMFGKEIHH